jgi:hypothetical protein
MARDDITHGRASTGRGAAGGGGPSVPAPPPPPPAIPAAPSAAVVAPATPPPPPPRAPASGGKSGRKCSYCGPLNSGFDGHDAKWCYVNPNSTVFKPDVRQRRIETAKGKGIVLPDYLQNERVEAVNAVQEGERPSLTADLVGALRMIGHLREDQVQTQVDRITNEMQEREGALVATICHQSDGECPTKVYSLAPGGEGLPVRLAPSLLEQLMEGCTPVHSTKGLQELLTGGAEDTTALKVTAITNALLAAAGQTRDMATNTGGVKWKPAREAVKKVLTAEQIVDRMKVTYPVLTAAKVDSGLRQLFLAELITQSVNERLEVVVPEGAALRMVSQETFAGYKAALSGLNVDNVQQVTAKLVALGLGGGQVS